MILGFEVQWNSYAKLSITVLMESILLWKELAVMHGPQPGVWAKRLEQGRLLSDWSTVSTREMDWTGLKLLLEGIEPKRVRRRYKNTVLAMQNMSTNAGA